MGVSRVVQGSLPQVAGYTGPWVVADQQGVGTFPFGFQAYHRQSLWSFGASLITPLAIQPPENEDWTLLSWAISATLAAYTWTDLENPIGPVWWPPAPPFGKLGKIIGGLLTQNNQSTSLASLANSVQPMLPLPVDTSLTAPLWDPAVDALPPVSHYTQVDGVGPTNVLSPSMPIEAADVLSTPIDVATQSPFAIGVWMTPSLAQNLELWILSMSYKVTFSAEPASGF
jgi:hypothetical protein